MATPPLDTLKAPPVATSLEVLSWFQKSLGNTYHTVRIFDQYGQPLATSSITYGYGLQWVETSVYTLAEATGMEVRQARAVIKKIRQLGNDNGFDVKRKADLHSKQ